MRPKLTLEECYGRANKQGIVIVEIIGEFIGSSTLVKVRLTCGHISTVILSSILYKDKPTCKGCVPKLPKVTSEDRIRQINEIDEIEFVSWKTTYTKPSSKANIRCLLCNNISEYRVDSILTKQCRCSECGDKRIGGYSETIFERKPQMKTMESVLYILEVSSPEERFFKIGISSRGKARVEHDLTKNYSVSVLVEETMPLYEAFLKEQKLIRNGKKYRPKYKFAGHTECVVDFPDINSRDET